VVMAVSLSGHRQDRRHLGTVNMKIDIAQIDRTTSKRDP
jgi:hypothetical protein